LWDHYDHEKDGFLTRDEVREMLEDISFIKKVRGLEWGVQNVGSGVWGVGSGEWGVGSLSRGCKRESSRDVLN
jgi:hypothetical protein